MAKLKEEGKIVAGGNLPGERAATFIVEAESHEEATELVQSFPFWAFSKWKVTPLESFEHIAAFARRMAEQRISAG